MSDVPDDDGFYFDLGSPLAYLVAERVLSTLPGPLPWIPVLERDLPEGEPWTAHRCEHERDAWREDVRRRAQALALQPLRWPAPFPFDSEPAMRAATYARQIGRAVPFAQAAFRQAFAGGHSLSDPDVVVVAGAACEMHPRAVLAGSGLNVTAEELARATARAAAVGIRSVPAIRRDGRTFLGEDAPEAAAALLHPAPR